MKASRRISLRDIYEKLNSIDLKITKVLTNTKHTALFDDRHLIVRTCNKIFHNKKALKLTISLLKRGYTYKEIAEILNKEGFLTSKSSVGRLLKFIRKLYYGR